MIKFAMISLMISTSLIFCSQNQQTPLVRRDIWPQHKQLTYSQNTKSNFDVWAARLTSRPLGTIYIAFQSGQRIFEPDASSLFHDLEQAYKQQAEHKDEKE